MSLKHLILCDDVRKIGLCDDVRKIWFMWWCEEKSGLCDIMWWCDTNLMYVMIWKQCWHVVLGKGWSILIKLFFVGSWSFSDCISKTYPTFRPCFLGDFRQRWLTAWHVQNWVAALGYPRGLTSPHPNQSNRHSPSAFDGQWWWWGRDTIPAFLRSTASIVYNYMAGLNVIILMPGTCDNPS